MKTTDINSLDYILNIITSDNKKNSLLDVLFTDDSVIDKSALIDFIKTCLDPLKSMEIKEYIDQLDNDSYQYTFFLINLRDRIISQITDDLGKEYSFFDIANIDYSIFWSMYAVAIKKCLGKEYATAELASTSYFDVITDTLNNYQIATHNDCINSFNMDVNNFTLKNTPELRLFLHSFHSKNRRMRTRKKNLHRVEKRAKKIVQVNKLAHQGNVQSIFSNKRYLVPGQFASAIIKLYLSN